MKDTPGSETMLSEKNIPPRKDTTDGKKEICALAKRWDGLGRNGLILVTNGQGKHSKTKISKTFDKTLFLFFSFLFSVVSLLFR